MVNNITILGFGSQAKTWASNLKDSGFEVTILLRKESKSIKMAELEGHRVISMPCSKNIDLGKYIAILTPDHTHYEILKELEKNIEKNTTIIFAHGFGQLKHNFSKKFPQLNFTLLAPKAIASEMRELYKQGKSFPGAISLQYSNKKNDNEIYLRHIALKLGMSRPTTVTFEEETICDLFSEQSLLCSLIPYGIRYAFEALRKRGIPAEMAFNECLFESKLIIQTLEKVGFEQFFEIISPNALIGGEKAKNSTEFQQLKVLFENLLDDISSKKFYEEIENSSITTLRNNVSKDWSSSEITHEWERQRTFNREALNEEMDDTST